MVFCGWFLWLDLGFRKSVVGYRVTLARQTFVESVFQQMKRRLNDRDSHGQNGQDDI